MREAARPGQDNPATANSAVASISDIDQMPDFPAPLSVMTPLLGLLEPMGFRLGKHAPAIRPEWPAAN